MTEEEKAEHLRRSNELSAHVAREKEHWTELAKEADALGYTLWLYHLTPTEINVELKKKVEPQ